MYNINIKCIIKIKLHVKHKHFDFCNISVTLQTLNTFNNVLL